MRPSPEAVGYNSQLLPARSVDDPPAAKSYEVNAGRVEVPWLVAGGVGNDFESPTALELQEQIGGVFRQSDGHNGPTSQQRERFDVGIDRSRQAELLTVVARRESDSAVEDDAPKAIDGEAGRPEPEGEVPRVVLDHAVACRPDQAIDAHADLSVGPVS